MTAVQIGDKWAVFKLSTGRYKSIKIYAKKQMERDRYFFTIKKANEINSNRKLAELEALEMMRCFERQGNQKHSIEGSHIYGQSVIVDKMFVLVVEKYKSITR